MPSDVLDIVLVLHDDGESQDIMQMIDSTVARAPHAAGAQKKRGLGAEVLAVRVVASCPAPTFPLLAIKACLGDVPFVADGATKDRGGGRGCGAYTASSLPRPAIQRSGRSDSGRSISWCSERTKWTACSSIVRTSFFGAIDGRCPHRAPRSRAALVRASRHQLLDCAQRMILAHPRFAI